MRVLFLGHCSYVTVGPLAAALEESLGTRIDVINLNRAGAQLYETDKQSFNEVVILPARDAVWYKSSHNEKGSVLLQLLKKGPVRKNVLKKALRFQLTTLKRYVKDVLTEELYGRAMTAFLDPYDVMHFHYLDPYFLQPIPYIKDHQKIILSFWGSDLFTVSGVSAYQIQLAAIEKAHFITMQTVEMRQVFLSKFGHQWKAKVRLAFFGVSMGRIAQIDRAKNDELLHQKTFRRKHTIDSSKVVITLGYSAAAGQQHLAILQILNALPIVYKQQIHVVIPLTYNNEDKEYVQKVIVQARESDFTVSLLTQYMSDEEVVELTVSTQILLNLRTTDAFNNAMMENLLAGNMVVNGAWLFYGTLTRWGVHFKEIATLEELLEILPFLLENRYKELSKNVFNSTILKEKIVYAHTKTNWISMYHEIKENISSYGA